MAGVNKVILVGNLGSDPEVRYFDNGGVVAKFNIATTESYQNKNGERVEQTEWHRIELWEGLAKVAEKYLKKGNQVYVEGRLRTDTWTDKEGQQRTGVTIRANSMTLLGGSNNAANTGNPAYAQNTPTPPGITPSPSNDPVPPGMGGIEDDDLPF